MAFLDYFMGSAQSKYAAVAMVASLIVVAVAMLFGKDVVPLGQKFVAILVMFLFALPGLALALFQLTCLVTGTKGNKMHPCGLYAWIGSVLMIVYAAIVIMIALMAMMKGTDVSADLAAMDAFQAKKVAESYFTGGMPVEGFAEEATGAPGPMGPTGPMGPPDVDPSKEVVIPTIETMEGSELVGAPDAHEPEMFSTCGAPL